MNIIEDWLRKVDVERCQSSRSLARFATRCVTVTRVILAISHDTSHDSHVLASTESRGPPVATNNIDYSLLGWIFWIERE